MTPPAAAAPPLSSTAAAAEAFALAQGSKISPSFQIATRGANAASKTSWDLAVLSAADTHQRTTAAWIIACAMVRQRGGSTRVYDVWHSAALSATPLAGNDRLLAESFIAPVLGVPTKPSAAHDQLQGYVTEWLWYLLASEKVEGHRTIEHIESPSWSVTEQGCDGLVVYRAVTGSPGGALSFRLWELKKHSSAAHVSATVARAYAQLEERALTYLAKIAGASAHVDGELGDLLDSLPDLWIDADAAAGVGVGVATNAHAPARCFTTMGARFLRLNTAGQLEGLIAAVEDLPEFALDVRRFVWSAL